MLCLIFGGCMVCGLVFVLVCVVFVWVLGEIFFNVLVCEGCGFVFFGWW